MLTESSVPGSRSVTRETRTLEPDETEGWSRETSRDDIIERVRRTFRPPWYDPVTDKRGAVMSTNLPDYEKLGSFYLGRRVAADGTMEANDLLLYDAKDLTTHAVCVGMTGSGKTGLCIGLLEEAAVDGVPSIIIDPKGDMANLALNFPDLSPGDFKPWVDPQAALRKGQSLEEFAASTAATWRKGLMDWGQDADRMRRLKAAAEVTIYTPGSDAGVPLTILKSFAAPSEQVLNDSDLLRDRIQSTTSGLLSLLRMDADPIRSREHILLSNILEHAWRAGKSLDLVALIQAIQTPPFDRVGVFDLNTFFPLNERFGLAMALNNLVASPSFKSWMSGEPLEVQRLLWTKEGKPRMAILSIAHLSESERMFFVTTLLNEVISWVRSVSGTSSLRAILYMDEVFGYLPPSANPPSKIPMLTLLKQARAFGLGVVLATQNPVDLDYKALSNAGTWFLGRLQTERDKLRVLDGLEGAAASSSGRFDRNKVDAMLSGLKSRVFLMNNVHDDEPTLFQTRWAMSYLGGPLTRDQIRRLTPPAQAVPERMASPEGNLTSSSSASGVKPQTILDGASAALSLAAPVLPSEIPIRYLRENTREPGELSYRPYLLAKAALHYVAAKEGVDQWEYPVMIAKLGEHHGSPWESMERVRIEPSDLLATFEEAAVHEALPTSVTKPSTFKSFGKSLESEIYRSFRLSVLAYTPLKLHQSSGESEGAFRTRVREAMRERRDMEIERLRQKYLPKVNRLKSALDRAQERVTREDSQYRATKTQTTISLGATVLGALFGRRSSAMGRATTTARGASRTAAAHEDVVRAREGLDRAQADLDVMAADFERELLELRSQYEETPECSSRELGVKKSDTEVRELYVLWVPYRTRGGESRRAVRFAQE